MASDNAALPRPYLGVTGFMARAEVDAALEALPAGVTLMCGVLVSAKTLRLERNRWWRRYPEIQDIAGIFSPDPRCLNLIHYSSDAPPNGATVGQLQTLGGAHCDGFQFNGVWPERWTLAALAGGNVVLQYTPGASTVLLAHHLGGARHCSRHVLVDDSGGKGLPLDVAQVRKKVEHLRSALPWDVGIGIAGGFCAETLPAVADLVREHRLSIDAEGRLRDGDDGGTLNLDKVKSYLAAATPLFDSEASNG